MTNRSLAFEPQRPAMLAETLWRRGIDSFSEIKLLLAGLLCAQRRQHSLGREGRFPQSNANRVVDRVGNRGNGGSQRALAGFLRSKWTLGINALHDDALHLRRLHRRG